MPGRAGGLSGIEYERFFTREGIDPFDEIEWEIRSAVIGNEKGKVVFEQRDVEIPRFWSQQATNIVVSKYFRGTIGTPERERSVKQLIGRVVDTITGVGAQAEVLRERRRPAGVQRRPEAPARLPEGGVQQPGVVQLRLREGAAVLGVLHQLGAGHDGLDPRPGEDRGDAVQVRIRHRLEPVGDPVVAASCWPAAAPRPGPVSFMKGFDAFAGVIKSGGKTRRAAKMVILNADHPDIVEFINCKVEEEKKAWALIDAGYDGSFTGPAYASVFFQNSNNSVRVTDEFMRAVLDDGEWQTRAVRDGAPMDTYKARDLMRQIAEATHVCGDPGHAVRHHRQRLAHLPEHGAHQREQPVLGVHVPGRLGVQPGVDQPDEVRARGRRVRLGGVRGGVPDDDHGAGDPGRQLELSDAGDREEQPRLPSARPRLREPGRAADVARPAVRQRLRAATTRRRSPR